MWCLKESEKLPVNATLGDKRRSRKRAVNGLNLCLHPIRKSCEGMTWGQPACGVQLSQTDGDSCGSPNPWEWVLKTTPILVSLQKRCNGLGQGGSPCRQPMGASDAPAWHQATGQCPSDDVAEWPIARSTWMRCHNCLASMLVARPYQSMCLHADPAVSVCVLPEPASRVDNTAS